MTFIMVHDAYKDRTLMACDNYTLSITLSTIKLSLTINCFS